MNTSNCLSTTEPLPALRTTRSGATRKQKQRPELKVIRVAAGSFFVGEIHLDGQSRVRRRADTVPSDIVLKILIQHTRQGETCGRLVGRTDGREFFWYVVGNTAPVERWPSQQAEDEIGELAEVWAEGFYATVCE